MGKVIKTPREVRIVEEDGVLKVSLHYGLCSIEYPDLLVRKGLSIEALTPREQAKVQEIMDWATGKMKEHEGIS